MFSHIKEVHRRLCRTVWSLYSAHRISGYFCLSGLLSSACGFSPRGCSIVATVAPTITSVFWTRKKKKRERQKDHASLSLPLPKTKLLLTSDGHS